MERRRVVQGIIGLSATLPAVLSRLTTAGEVEASPGGLVEVYKMLRDQWERLRPPFDLNTAPRRLALFISDKSEKDRYYRDKADVAPWRVVEPRVIMNLGPNTKSRYSQLRDTLNNYGKERGWGPIVLWQDPDTGESSVWGSPMTIMASERDIKKRTPVKVWSNGGMVEIDPVLALNLPFAVAITQAENTDVYQNIQDGAIHARLREGQTVGKLAIAVAYDATPENLDLTTGGNTISNFPCLRVLTAPAGAYANVMYCKPTDETGGNFQVNAVKAYLQETQGHLDVHVPSDRDDYIGQTGPVVVVQIPLNAANQNGESEVVLVPAYGDTSPGKNRVTVNDLRDGFNIGNVSR